MRNTIIRIPFVLFALLIVPFVLHSQPCSDYTCDSLAVKKILALNGMDSLSVRRVADSSSGRITSLTLAYGTTLSSLPQKLTQLSPDIGKLTALKQLDITGNNLSAIPEELRQCIHLETLMMGGNAFDSIPAAIWHLSNLQDLYLSNNRLSTVADSIEMLTLLKRLSLDANALTRLPGPIVRLKKLEVLSFSGNRITTLPDSIVHLDSIKCIFIANNAMCSLSEAIVNWLNAVRKITFCQRAESAWPTSQQCASQGNTSTAPESALARSIQMLPEKNGIVSIRVHFPSAHVLSIEVFDSAGRLVDNLRDSRSPAGNSTFALSTKLYAPGVYSVRFKIDGKIALTKRLNILK
jgi:hypothetical protein